MELKELGRTGVNVPEIGVGTWRYRGGVEPLRRGIELGASLIDTAEMYSTEGVVGEAIHGIRDRVFVATKVSGSHLRYDDVMRAAEASLGRLGVDRIDLYQVHWPGSSVPIGETMRAMEALADSGSIRYVGVSNFSLHQLQEAQSVMGRHPIVSNQVHYSLKRREIEKELLPYCQDNGVTVMAYTPLESGSLAARPRSSGGVGFDILERVAREAGKSPAQVALNSCTSRSGVIGIPKSNSVARVEENSGASGWRLSEDHLRLLEDAFPA